MDTSQRQTWDYVALGSSFTRAAIWPEEGSAVIANLSREVIHEALGSTRSPSDSP